MPNVVVVGAQWGDEGKGKIVDWLSERADVIARFQGGHNAGHTLVIDGTVYKLSLLPSGHRAARQAQRHRQRRGARPLGADRRDRQAARRRAWRSRPTNLMIAENTPLILPLHQDLDRMREEAAGAAKIGTTGRGIGPAYEDKVGRRCDPRRRPRRRRDARDPARPAARPPRRAAPRPRRRRRSTAPRSRPRCAEVAPKVLPYAAPVWRVLAEKRREGKRILFEGAQGALLDIDFGTYPYVTSSNTLAGMAATGTGMGPGAIGFVLGIVKAYTTRVGEGPFPAELDRRDRPAARRARPRVRHRHRAQAPLRLVRRGAGAPDLHDQRRHRHRADQARRARRLRGAEDLHRLRPRRRRGSTTCRPRRRCRPG